MTDIAILTNPMSWGHGFVLRDLTIERVSHWLVGIWFSLRGKQRWRERGEEG